VGSVDMGEWDDLAGILNEKEAKLHKEDLDEIGENNIDTEYFEDNLTTGEQVICDFSGIIEESGFLIKVVDNETKETSEYESDYYLFINGSIESDEIGENNIEAQYNDFDDNKVLIRYARVEKGPYFEFEINEKFDLSKLELYSYNLEPFNDCSIIIGGIYDGEKIEFDFGNTTGVCEEVKIIHNTDEYSDREESDNWEY
jgi:hypothetical protein